MSEQSKDRPADSPMQRPDGGAHAPRAREEEVARASDIEQAHGRAGNSRDTGQAADEDGRTPAEVAGSSGHVVRTEIVEAIAHPEASGSPGADADRQAAQGQG